jgi:hypothetical protein
VRAPSHVFVVVRAVVSKQLVVKERAVEVHARLLGVKPQLAVLQQAKIEVDDLVDAGVSYRRNAAQRRQRRTSSLSHSPSRMQPK